MKKILKDNNSYLIIFLLAIVLIISVFSSLNQTWDISAYFNPITNKLKVTYENIGKEPLSFIPQHKIIFSDESTQIIGETANYKILPGEVVTFDYEIEDIKSNSNMETKVIYWGIDRDRKKNYTKKVRIFVER